MKLDDKQKLNSLKSKIENFLSKEPIDLSIWERKRDSIFASTQPILKERTKLNARVISTYKKLSKELSEEEMTILNAIHSNDGQALGLHEYLTQTDYGEDIIRNLERLNLVERADEPDMWDFYFLSMFGLNMMLYLDKATDSKIKHSPQKKPSAKP